MRIAKGIKGIRKDLNRNGKGWHVIIDGRDSEFNDITLKEMLTEFDDTHSLIWIGGNVIFLTTEEVTEK
jgi:hypothetical protein